MRIMLITAHSSLLLISAVSVCSSLFRAGSLTAGSVTNSVKQSIMAIIGKYRPEYSSFRPLLTVRGTALLTDFLAKSVKLPAK